MTRCSCGFENRDGRTICYQCKQALPEFEPMWPPPPHALPKIACPLCSHQNPPDAGFCGGCGTSFRALAGQIDYADLPPADACHKSLIGTAIAFRVLAFLVLGFGVIGGIAIIVTAQQLRPAAQAEAVSVGIACILLSVWWGFLMQGASQVIELFVHMGVELWAIRRHLEENDQPH